MDYDYLVEDAEKKILLLDELMETSSLPKSVDSDFVNELLIKIRKQLLNL